MKIGSKKEKKTLRVFVYFAQSFKFPPSIAFCDLLGMISEGQRRYRARVMWVAHKTYNEYFALRWTPQSKAPLLLFYTDNEDFSDEQEIEAIGKKVIQLFLCQSVIDFICYFLFQLILKRNVKF